MPGPLAVKLRVAMSYHLCHLEVGPSKGLDPKPYLGKFSINEITINTYV